MVKKLWRYVKTFSSDTGTLWTDRQTDRFAISVSRVSMLTRDKKEWTDFNENWHISSPKARAWTIDLEGQEVKVSDTGGRSYIWKSGGDIILNPLSRVDRGIQWATEILPLKRGPWVLNIVLTAPPADMRLSDALIIITSHNRGGESTLDLLCKSRGNSGVTASTSRHWKPQESLVWRWFYIAGKCNTGQGSPCLGAMGGRPCWLSVSLCW